MTKQGDNMNQPVHFSQKNNIYLILAITIGGFLSLYNSVALNIALPTFLEVFQTDLNTVQWIMVSYTLMMGVLSPTAGYFCDKYSCRNVYCASMAGFAAAALLSAFCHDIYQLILLRLVQGALAAFIVPCSLTIVYQFVPASQKATYLTLQTLSISMGPSIGPVLSGFLLTLFHWHWVFWINVPLALLTAWAVYRAVPYQLHQTSQRLDYLGFTFVILGTILFLFSFQQIGMLGFASPVFWLMFLGGLCLIALFIYRCLHNSHPVLNFHILQAKGYRITLLITSCVSMALCLAPFVLAIYFQNILGYSPLYSGLLLLIPAIFSIGGAPLAQYLYQRMNGKLLILSSILFILLGNYFLSWTNLQTSLFFVIGWLCLRYLGIGLSGMPLTDYGMSAIHRDLSSHGSALINWCKMMATSLSLSIFTMVLNLRIANYAATQPLMKAQMHGIDDVFLYSSIIMIIALLSTLRLERHQNQT